jgi:hypothetical protein
MFDGSWSYTHHQQIEVTVVDRVWVWPEPVHHRELKARKEEGVREEEILDRVECHRLAEVAVVMAVCSSHLFLDHGGVDIAGTAAVWEIYCVGASSARHSLDQLLLGARWVE